ncbi:MAG: NlpC/P60 family protein [Acidimicrobiia bacterium]
MVVTTVGLWFGTSNAFGATDPYGGGVDITLGAGLGGNQLSFVTSSGVDSLIWSPQSLADLDPISGALSPTSVLSMGGEQQVVVADLLSIGAIGEDALNAAVAARQLAEERRQAELARKAEEAKALAGTQNVIGPDGCPTSVLPNGLRNGAESVGVYEICKRSVEQAPTAEAAKAVIWAIQQIGSPYSQAERNKVGIFDCSSLVSRSWQAAGVPIAPPGQNAQTTATIRAARWAVEIDSSQQKPGDLIFSSPGHVAMVLADGWMVHTYRYNDFVHIAPIYKNPYTVRRVDPTKV